MALFGLTNYASALMYVYLLEYLIVIDNRSGGLLLGATTYSTNDAGDEGRTKPPTSNGGGRSDHICFR